MRFILLLAFLAGCSTLESRQAELTETCTGYGFRPGTEEFRQCWMKVDQENIKRRARILSNLP